MNNRLSQIFTGYKWGIDFFNEIGEIVHTAEFDNEAAFNAEFENPTWPETAVSLDSWKRKQFRAPINGIDYGPGSVKARFGGYVPRAAYQLGGGAR